MKKSGLVNYSTFDYCLVDVIGDKNLIIGQNVSFSEDRNQKVSAALDLKYGYLEAPQGIYFYGDVTINAWIILRSVSFNARFFLFSDKSVSNSLSKYSSYLTSHAVALQIKNSNISRVLTAKEALKLNQWYFLSAVIKSSKALIYFNGTIQGSQLLLTLMNVRQTNNTIGFRNSQDPAANAKIDEFKIFNRTLIQTEILTEMKQSRNKLK